MSLIIDNKAYAISLTLEFAIEFDILFKIPVNPATIINSRTPSILGLSEPSNQIIATPTNMDPVKSTYTSVSISDPEGRKGTKEFHFDSVFGIENTQEFVYDQTVRPIIDRCLDGYNGCVFVYGQTASGKTYTMQGPPNASEKEKGIMMRATDQIMKHVKDASRENDGLKFSVSASYLEIYQETLRDLLCSPEEQGELRIRIDPESIAGNELHIEGITNRQLINASDFHKIIQTGTKNRTVAETNMNEVSSRSHAVLTLVIEQYQRMDGSDDLGARKRSKIHLIDLAGKSG